MNIKLGKYTLHSDGFCMWIDEEYIIENGKNKGKTGQRRIAGYATTFSNLMSSFKRRKICGLEAESIDELLNGLKKIEEDMEALRTRALEEDFKIVRNAAGKLNDEYEKLRDYVNNEIG